MGEIVTPPHPCSTWNERKGYLQRLSWRPYFFLLDEFRSVGVAARQLSRDPYFGERGESFKNGRLRKTYPKTIKPVDPRYKGIMGVLDPSVSLTSASLSLKAFLHSFFICLGQ